MRRFVPLALSVVVLAACQDGDPSFSPTGSLSPSAALQSLNLSAGPERVVPGEVIVKLRDGVDPAIVGWAHGLALGRLGYRGAFAVLRGAAGNEHVAAAALRGDSRVVYAEPNFLRQKTSIDPRLWAFYNPGGLTMTFTRGGSRGLPVTSETSVNDADEDNVEGYAAGGGDVLIGSIDTGVDFGHQEFLAGQLIAGRDWYSNDDDPTDEDGHGTHTTGTMVGRTVGVAGVSGAGPHVKVLVQRVCGPQGCPTTAIVSAIRAAADAGVVAMNLSLGGASESQAEKDAIAYATGKGALVIASAGNDGTSTVECPACDPNAISVAALNWSSTLAYYSNWGSGLDISAPGGQMYSNTSEEQGIYSSVPGGYEYLQGTSMAAPQVTGTAAIVASTAGLRGSQLRSRILGTADGLGSASQYGAGRLNSYRAVTGATLTESGGDSGGGGGSGGGGTCHGGPKHCP